MYKLTHHGRRTVDMYIKELKAKKKEILDAGLDTANDTTLPSAEDIEADIAFFGDYSTSKMFYYNGWGVTDHYDSDYPIELRYNRDFVKTA